ncbi:MAG: hypothetical protein GX331_03545 [Firmicutes bacterium]|jgi:hypothetical protein|nr:hypothetical protein [Bacillota bacterium]
MDRHIKYGGVRFVNNASPEEINNFVRNLPEHQKDSLFEVVRLLDQEGLITLIDGDNTTVDKNMEEFMIPNNGDGH